VQASVVEKSPFVDIEHVLEDQWLRLEFGINRLRTEAAGNSWLVIPENLVVRLDGRGFQPFDALAAVSWAVAWEGLFLQRKDVVPDHVRVASRSEPKSSSAQFEWKLRLVIGTASPDPWLQLRTKEEVHYVLRCRMQLEVPRMGFTDFSVSAQIRPPAILGPVKVDGTPVAMHVLKKILAEWVIRHRLRPLGTRLQFLV